ncbi:insulinase-like peptidase [Cryptosporidium sp. chipmunk genotype I]|uniref:insulinase-like peptidase n=1 Tax=Cryptosporidium sp. chipmunk genotype I TaxID=1280935 RepID=UPI00351A0C4A|nr:insulinase-like peptidase [Cryptosporidium sp. chipmunk genotype I]
MDDNISKADTLIESLNLANSSDKEEFLKNNMTSNGTSLLISSLKEEEYLSELELSEFSFIFGEEKAPKPLLKICQPCQHSKVSDITDKSTLGLPSNYLRDYRYLKLKNGVKVVLINDAIDMEIGVGIQYPVGFIEGCNDLGGVRFISNVLIKGLKDYFREVALIKSYFLHNSKVSINFSTNEDLLQILKYFSEMFVNFEISMDKFIEAYKMTLDQFRARLSAQYTQIVGKLFEIAHPNSYFRNSCHTFYEPVLQNEYNGYELVQLRKKMVNAIRNGVSSNLLSVIITTPCSLHCSYLTISKGLSSMKNMNFTIPNAFDNEKYPIPFSTDNLIGKRLTLPSYLPIKQFFFCFFIEESFKANVREIEGALTEIFIHGENSLFSHLKSRGLIKNMNIRILLPDISPILSFRVEVEDAEKNSPAEILSMIRQVVYTFTESPLLEKYVMNYFKIRNSKFSKVFATSSTSDVIFKLFNVIDTSPLEDINNIILPNVLLESVETVLSYTTFDHFFLIRSCNFTPEEIMNKTVEIDNINIEFWNSINADLLTSYNLEEPEVNPLLLSSYKANADLYQHTANISKINFSYSENKTLIDPFNDRVSFSIVHGFQRPSTIDFFRFNILHEDYFSIKSILFKCFIVFAMNIFLKPYRHLFTASSSDLKINCGLDQQTDLELGYDSISVFMSSHSQAFPQLLNYTSFSFNSATSLNETNFYNTLKHYKEYVNSEYTSTSGIYYAKSIINGMLNPSFPSYSKYIKIIERVEYSDYVDYCGSLISFNNIKGLISGDISTSEARITLSNFINSLNLGNFTKLNDPNAYNLPILMICPQPNMPRHFLIKRNQIDTSSMVNLVLTSVIIDNNIRNILMLNIIETSILKLSEFASLDKVHLSLKWEIKKHSIHLNILSLSSIRYGENGIEPIIEYSTEALKRIYNLGNHIELKQKSFLSKTKRIVTIKRDSEETRFNQLYYSFMMGRKPYMQFALLNEFESITGKDFIEFGNEVKNSLTYIVIISSHQQTNKNTENEITGFTKTEGYPNTF